MALHSHTQAALSLYSANVPVLLLFQERFACLVIAILNKLELLENLAAMLPLLWRSASKTRPIGVEVYWAGLHHRSRLSRTNPKISLPSLFAQDMQSLRPHFSIRIVLIRFSSLSLSCWLTIFFATFCRFCKLSILTFAWQSCSKYAISHCIQLDESP
jgi:hypothetical protein